MIPVVELYSTEHCELCAEARSFLLELRATIPFELQEVKLNPAHPQYSRYFTFVPVIMINGKHELTAPIDRKRVAFLLRRESHRDMARSAGIGLKWMGLMAAIVGIVIRLVGEAAWGYLIFIGAIVVFSIGWMIARDRHGGVNQ
jgi:glutaredoxin